MEVGAALPLGLGFFDGDAVLVGKGVLADAGHLPTDFDSGRWS